MMLIPAGVKVHLALGYTDLRKGIDGLGVLVERCRRWHAGTELTCAYCSGGGEPWGLADQRRRQASRRSK